MQSSVTVSWHYIPFRLAKIKMLNNSNVGEDMEHQELIYVIVGYINWYNHFEEFWLGLVELKTNMPCEPGIPLQGKNSVEIFVSVLHLSLSLSPPHSSPGTLTHVSGPAASAALCCSTPAAPGVGVRGPRLTGSPRPSPHALRRAGRARLLLTSAPRVKLDKFHSRLPRSPK